MSECAAPGQTEPPRCAGGSVPAVSLQAAAGDTTQTGIIEARVYVWRCRAPLFQTCSVARGDFEFSAPGSGQEPQAAAVVQPHATAGSFPSAAPRCTSYGVAEAGCAVSGAWRELSVALARAKLVRATNLGVRKLTQHGPAPVTPAVQLRSSVQPAIGAQP